MKIRFSYFAIAVPERIFAVEKCLGSAMITAFLNVNKVLQTMINTNYIKDKKNLNNSKNKNVSLHIFSAKTLHTGVKVSMIIKNVHT